MRRSVLFLTDLLIKTNYKKKLTCGCRHFSTMESNFVTNRKRSSDFATPSPKRTNFVGLSPLKQLTNIDTPTNRPFRVSIEGNIGAGKSTLVKYFEQFKGIETYPEPIEWWRNVNGHNLLDLMYSDPNQWLKVFQSYVQLTRVKIQTSKPKETTSVQMFERSVQNNRFCFVECARNSGYLRGADYAMLNEWYKWIRENVDIQLDLIVYLRSTPEVVYERMKARGRPEEAGVTLEYLKQLHDSHEMWLMTDDERFNTVPVLVLDADQTLQDVYKQFETNEHRILGCDSRGVRKVSMDKVEKVKKALSLNCE